MGILEVILATSLGRPPGKINIIIEYIIWCRMATQMGAVLVQVAWDKQSEVVDDAGHRIPS
jgi:hypothetical protein